MPGAQQGGTQRRREGQRQERREQHRDGDRERELAVDRADAAGLQGAGDEHRRQHHGDGDDGAGDLAHGLARGLLGRQMLLAHDALDRLDDHDGIVHDDADGQRHPEQAQRIDREADRVDADERAEQATGITSVGISVARMFCRNTSITRNTSTDGAGRVYHHFADGRPR